jgi:hypothetical protein
MTFLTPSIITLQVDGGSTSEFTLSSQSNGRLTLSDHSRSPLSISYENIENFQRMANGTARKYVIAKKKVLTCSWSMLPTITAMTADGKSDSKTMKAFYEKYCNNSITLTLYNGRNADATTAYAESIKVFWADFSYDVVKRFKNFDYWNVTADFVEI